ncbi:hypothetical protein OAS39_00590 [Pirellulales bacterium]|nr:hypothetical protein [Pirellulales bacterium]
MATDPQDIQLTGSQRRLIAELADQTGKPWPELLEEVVGRAKPSVATTSNGKSGRTLYDAFAEKGLIGCIHSGTGDLSTNPKHMEGFGKDAWPEDSD